VEEEQEEERRERRGRREALLLLPCSAFLSLLPSLLITTRYYNHLSTIESIESINLASKVAVAPSRRRKEQNRKQTNDADNSASSP
jgi:hypothetical protein